MNRDLLIITASIAGAVLLLFGGRRRIVRFARSLVGQQEITGNLGFTNEKLQEMMQQVGWRRGDQWCVYYAKLVWYNMASTMLKPLIMSKITGNSQETYKNISQDQSGAFRVSKYPKPGDIVIWQYYESGQATSRGHAGIVTSSGPNAFETTEGNTNVSGSSEGYIVADHIREYDFNVNNGLRLKGFLRIA